MSELTDKAQRVKKEHEKNWLSVDGVTAVGVGLVEDGAVGIIISVSEDEQKMRKRFPQEVDGVPVEVQETGPFKAQ